MAINSPRPRGFALGLGQFMDHKSLATAVYLLNIYVCISVCHAPRPPGQATSSKWRLVQFSGCRLQTLGAEAGRDLDKFTTQFYQVRLTTAPRLVQFV